MNVYKKCIGFIYKMQRAASQTSGENKKMGMLFTYTNRSNQPVLEKKPAPSYSKLVRIPANRQSMFSIIHTPASSCSSCGH
jgi:hypothetical protein